jgi:hypothetical protein
VKRVSGGQKARIGGIEDKEVVQLAYRGPVGDAGIGGAEGGY